MLHLCAVIIGELQSGIEVTLEQDEAKASEVEAKLKQASEWMP